MLKRIGLIAAVFALSIPIGAAEDYPGVVWGHVKSLTESGWSATKLKAARQYSSTIPTDAVVIVEDGLVVAEWGSIMEKSWIHSQRKSYLSALYGIYVGKGVIRLSTTLAELGIDDNPPSLTAEEKRATIEDLLKARSGVYHPSLEETASMQEHRPARGSHPPGTFWFYNNWDFNALGSIFEKLTGRKIFEEVKLRLADPLQMEDFQLADCKYDRGPASVHPAYPMKITARDMARFGLLYMHEGAWRGRQIVPRDWVRRSTTSYSRAGSMGGYGYLWWVAVGGKQYPGVTLDDGSFSAEGVGGNFLVVIPSRKLVVVNHVNTNAGHTVKPAEFGQLLALILDAKRSAE